MNSYNGFSPAQRSRALRWLNAEYAAGRRTRPERCDACGQTAGALQAHSEDYSEPFGAHIGEHGLCYVCHMMIHCRFSAPGPWERYRRHVRSGYRVAVGVRDFGTIRTFLNGGDFTWLRTATVRCECGEIRDNCDCVGLLDVLFPEGVTALGWSEAKMAL